MDEKEFRRMLELFPVVRSRDYCVRPPLLQAPILRFPPTRGAIGVLCCAAKVDLARFKEF
jgi:hypothetical protein